MVCVNSTFLLAVWFMLFDAETFVVQYNWRHRFVEWLPGMFWDPSTSASWPDVAFSENMLKEKRFSKSLVLVSNLYFPPKYIKIWMHPNHSSTHNPAGETRCSSVIITLPAIDRFSAITWYHGSLSFARGQVPTCSTTPPPPTPQHTDIFSDCLEPREAIGQ